jgi:hypothetical protein
MNSPSNTPQNAQEDEKHLNINRMTVTAHYKYLRNNSKQQQITANNSK